jgi:hydroxypyruvate reductase
MNISLPTLKDDWEKDINFIINQSLLSVNPYKCVAEKIDIRRDDLFILGKKIDLSKINDIYVIGVGKAVIPMAKAVIDKIGNRITSGLLISKHQIDKGKIGFGEKIQIFFGGHPIPNRQSIESTEKLITFLEKVNENDLIINLISGGGSALMVSPYEGITLDDIKLLTNILLRSGATIQEMNTIRKHIDKIKGGGLARMTYPTRMETLILSDVLGDQISMIASGPTSMDETTYMDAWGIIYKYNIKNEIPKSIKNHFEKGVRGEVQETVKSGDEVMNKITNTIIGSLATAITSAEKAAKEIGYNTVILSTNLIGEAREVGKVFGSILTNMVENDYLLKRPACVIAGGETTVTILGNGKGGRNQELALGAVEQIDNLRDCCLISIATDGEDGPTDAAGAFVTGRTRSRAIEKGLDYEQYLADNDAYNFFKIIGNLVKIGSTGTNVNDLLFLFAF